jgi:hypothetical protein
MTFFRYIVVFETLPSGWVTGKAEFASRSGMKRPLREGFTAAGAAAGQNPEAGFL